MVNVFEEIEKLKLPSEEFVILGSGILAALGIRESNDIDILATPGLFARLKTEGGWKYEVVEIGGTPREKLTSGLAEVFKDFRWQGGSMSPEEGIASAVQIRGINFLPLERLREIKVQMGREKDVRDVALIDKYLVRE